MKKTIQYELTAVESIQADRNRDLIKYLSKEGIELHGHQVYDRNGIDPSLLLGFYRGRSMTRPTTLIEVVPSSRLEVVLDAYFARKRE